MKRLLAVAMFLLALPCFAQLNQPTFQYTNVIPNGTCTGTPPIQIMYLTGIAYSCNNGTWGNFAGGGGGGGTPTGPAGGVLSGFFPNPSGFSANAFDSPPPIGNVTPNTGAFSGITISGAGPGVIQPTAFSAAGTPLPTCNLAAVNSEAVVSDATAPTSMGSYVSGGAITAPVVCSFNGTSYAWLTVGGASGATPIGSAGGALGGFYPNPTFPAQALANGMTATTQSAGDSSTKVATDGFVIANAGGGSTIPATNLVLKGNGVAGQAVAATAGTDYFAPLTAGFYGLVPVSNGAGTSFSLQQPVLSFGSSFDQFSQQQANNSNWTTLRVNDENNVFYADGFTSAGQYAGIGAAQVAYGGSTEYPLCQAVSYSGANYIAVGHNNMGIIPGTNLAIWSPAVPNSGPTTAWDCGAFTAAAYAIVHSQQTSYVSGSGFYTTQGFIEPNGLYAVNLSGQGIFGSVLTYTGTTASPMIYRPTGGNYNYLHIKNFIMDGGGVASSVLDLGALNQSSIEEIQAQDIAPGALGSGNFFFRFGRTPGDAFQMYASHLTTSGLTKANTGIFLANLTSGTITSFTITNGGTGYTAPSSTLVYRVQVTGYGSSGTATQPCTTMPTWTGVPVTVSGGAITAINAPDAGTGTGCTGTLYVQVYGTYPVDYSVIWNASDSTLMDSTFYVGQVATTLIQAGDNVFFHIHPSVVPNGIILNGGSSVFYGTELDTVFNYGFQFFQPYSSTAAVVSGTHGYDAQKRLAGSVAYYLASSTANVAFTASGELCDAAPVSPPTGWAEFVTQSGPIVTSSDYLTKATPHMTVYGNDQTCGETMGDYTPQITVGTLNLSSGGFATLGANTFTGNQLIQTPTAATSGANQNSPIGEFNAAYWNGSVSAIDSYQFKNTPNTGTNPSTTLSLVHAGSSGGSNFVTAVPFNFTGAVSLQGGVTQFASTVLAEYGNISINSGGSITFPNSGAISGTTGLPSFNAYIVNGTAPTITGCGTISAQHGGATAGDFTTTTAGTCTAVFALPTAPNGWHCDVTDITKHVVANIMMQSATSTTSCTVTGTTAASDVLSFVAVAY